MNWLSFRIFDGWGFNSPALEQPWVKPKAWDKEN
jgi:hypothetical protein